MSDDLIKENERLRGALRQLLVDLPATLDEPDSDAEVIAKMREAARAALTDEISKPSEIERMQNWNRLRAEDIINLGQQVGRLETELAVSRAALEKIDRIAVAKKAGATRNMQAVARAALTDERDT